MLQNPAYLFSVDSERLQFFLERFGGLHQVVVRDAGEEEMVSDVSVRDVVHQLVNSEAVRAIDRLQLALHVAPGSVLEHLKKLQMRRELGSFLLTLWFSLILRG